MAKEVKTATRRSRPAASRALEKKAKRVQLEMYNLDMSHFTTVETDGKKVLSLNLPAAQDTISVVLFYKANCPHSGKFFQPYEKTLKMLHAASRKTQPALPVPVFYLCALDKSNQKLVAMSKDTSTPLQYVPYCMLYVNSLPHKAYKGQPIADRLFNFIAETTNAVLETTSQPVSTEEKSQGEEQATSCPIVDNTQGFARPIKGKDLRIYKKMDLST